MLDLSSFYLDCTVKFRGVPTLSIHRTFQPFLDCLLSIFTVPKYYYNQTFFKRNFFVVSELSKYPLMLFSSTYHKCDS